MLFSELVALVLFVGTSFIAVVQAWINLYVVNRYGFNKYKLDTYSHKFGSLGSIRRISIRLKHASKA